MFDLESAIADWRRKMMAVGIKSGEALEELESHLRDDLQAQLEKGLPPKHAFALAVARLGPGGALREEYSKIASDKFSFLPRILLIACFVTAPIMFLAAGWNLWDTELSASG